MPSPSPTPLALTTEPVLFRPSKKRKIYRQRAGDDENEPTAVSTPIPASTPPSSAALPNEQSLDELIASGSIETEIEGTAVSMTEIIRLRNLRRNKRGGGVEFRAEGARSGRNDHDQALILREGDGDGNEEAQDEEKPRGVLREFAPQTGTVGDVNKHMMAYIDSQIAKRRSEGLSTAASSSTTTHQQQHMSPIPHSGSNTLEVQRQPAALGKLQEIDLGEEARDRNVARTEMARRRLDGEEMEDIPVPGKKGKVRLGRDGKPWRGRKRRGSDDVKRDRLVEEVLRENRLEIYDEPEPEDTAINDDQAADDRIAEAFRREFMDAVSQRQRKKTAPAPPPSRSAGGKKEEEVLKGPKLGGSRNARAAMRDSMLKSGKK